MCDPALRVTAASFKLAMQGVFRGVQVKSHDEHHDAPQATSSILIVDDIDANLFALEDALALLGRPIVRARSGTEVLKALLQQDFALVLLDVTMPIMDGYETARWIRSRQRSANLPIIFVTAHDQDEIQLKEAYKLGVVDVLFKPLDPDILRAKTQVFIELHERTQELARLQARSLLDEQREEFLKREVAAEQRAKTQLARVNEQLALADRRKTEFLATLAHELRNPLAPIRTALDVLRHSPDAIPSVRVIDILDRQVKRMTSLVDDMLDISRIVSGKLVLNTEELELRTVVEHALADCAAVVSDRRHRLTVNAPDELIWVRADALRLGQVIVNLLTNAARYTNPGGAIEVTWGVRDGVAYIRVRDDGIGIHPDVIESVFEMFAQEGVAREHGGLGLGLPLAKRLIELHGGTIRGSSEGRDCGSTFEISLPFAKTGARSQASSAPGRGMDVPAACKRVLIIDDNQDAREMMAMILEARGHDVTTAHDGPSGLALVCERFHDIALVDLVLPGFDGIELVRRAREGCAHMPTKFVAMTGYGQDGDRLRTTMAGFDAHLLKPVASTDVFDIIDSLCT